MDEQKKFFYCYREYFDTFVWLDKEFKKKFYPKQKKEVEKDFSLLSRFIDFKEGFQEEQKKLLETYKSKLGGDWDVDPEGVLYIYWRKKEEPRIGIECVFEDETIESPHGILYIYVASWDKPYFGRYKENIDKEFPNKKERDKRREFRLVAAITPEGNQDVIVSILEKTYKTLKRIIDDY